MYYQNKIEILKTIFDAKDIIYKSDSLTIRGVKYPIIEDVIILSSPDKQSDFVRNRLNGGSDSSFNAETKDFARDIQYTFGQEWKGYDRILAEHKEEFLEYFDLVDLSSLRSASVCDLGCGSGRWSYYLKDVCKKIILVDFSDAIFTARKNLKDADNCLFFMCDLKELPFREDFADFLLCIGVLHHLPTSCLDEVRRLKRFSAVLLIYLYYSLDNRPFYFRFMLKSVTLLRLFLCRIKNPLFRKVFSSCAALSFYMPLILLGRLLKSLGLSRFVPLYETYSGKSLERIRQDAYDRFFTRIEQRVSRREILELKDTFSDIMISDNKPYWHFLCKR